MSNSKEKAVQFYTEGELVETVTDPATARLIGIYKDVYNKIDSFKITSRILIPKRTGFTRKAIQAQSTRLRILCTKEYIPNVPEVMDGAVYECGILNLKTHAYQAIDNGVQTLFYKLFSEHVK